MSVLETLRAEEAKLAAKYAELSAACKAARQARDEAAANLAQAKDAAGAVWNELAGVRKAISEMAKTARPAVKGSGELKAEGAK